MKRIKDKAALTGFIVMGAMLLLAVLSTPAGAPAALAFLACYGAATIGGTKPINRLAGATVAGVLTFVAVSMRGMKP